ncbi:hypothetical protein [endosymbiont GvMRE of Glomus versiforme]|uniref:hypothetical protein n=1 Tax=endosymbiont GvMRE of Glomus versiforme TaxID=2039283 RepID=UPI000EE557A4|nr:hypothetical protein [endosymbiont GvMRE of Glomus versiforme]RHZ36585.1 hypothetical protein GvMRE_I2g608 [endosymbiont GvMRE of Glomus versiforme]
MKNKVKKNARFFELERIGYIWSNKNPKVERIKMAKNTQVTPIKILRQSVVQLIFFPFCHLPR